MNRSACLLGLILSLMMTACAPKQVPYDYTAFLQAKPKSILVLPPLNHSPEVNAGHSLLAQVTFPLAESGYYVFPVAVVEETFRQNGLTVPEEIHAVSLEKLSQIFGADSILYLDVKEYGTKYLVIASDTRVTVSARLVDAKSGQVLWEGSAAASSSEQRSNSGGGIVGMLAEALVEQIVNTIAERGHDIAGITSRRLLTAGMPRGLLYGPRSPLYGKETQP